MRAPKFVIVEFRSALLETIIGDLVLCGETENFACGIRWSEKWNMPVPPSWLFLAWRSSSSKFCDVKNAAAVPLLRDFAFEGFVVDHLAAGLAVRFALRAGSPIAEAWAALMGKSNCTNQ